MPRHFVENNCICQRCGKHFHQKPSRIAKGKGQFCSLDCKFPNRHDSIADRFFGCIGEKTIRGCILWGGSVDTSKGYGTFFMPGSRPTGAHRVAYELMVGPIPEGLYVLHRCDNRLCINPTHLFLGTHQDNIADCVAKGRQARGEKQGFSKLTADDIIAIRRRCQDGESQRSIAEEFGVCQQSISNILRGVLWKHVP